MLLSLHWIIPRKRFGPYIQAVVIISSLPVLFLSHLWKSHRKCRSCLSFDDDHKRFGCELLSESYLCIIVHNLKSTVNFIKSVVNCFQNRIFALSFTTPSGHDNFYLQLWIAFRIVSLHYRSQLLGVFFQTLHGCELLSESYLCIIVHNHKNWLNRVVEVVNCFQNRIFALSFTTLLKLIGLMTQLWIAFRIVSLHYRSQR